jgi:hypothetical protein
MLPKFQKAHRGRTWAIKDRGCFEKMVRHLHVEIDALFAIPTAPATELTFIRARMLEGAQSLCRADIQTMLSGATPISIEILWEAIGKEDEMFGETLKELQLINEKTGRYILDGVDVNLMIVLPLGIA